MRVALCRIAGRGRTDGGGSGDVWLLPAATRAATRAAADDDDDDATPPATVSRDTVWRRHAALAAHGAALQLLTCRAPHFLCDTPATQSTTAAEAAEDTRRVCRELLWRDTLQRDCATPPLRDTRRATRRADVAFATQCLAALAATPARAAAVSPALR
eukprot:gene22358-16786_t